MAETLISEGALNEFLNIKALPRQYGVNISVVNWNGRRLLDRVDVLRWLRTNAESYGSPLLHRLYAELAEVTAEGE